VVVGSLLCVVQAMMTMHLWVAKAGHVQVSELERVLKRVIHGKCNSVTYFKDKMLA